MGDYDYFVLTGENVLLPGRDEPLPGTVKVDLTTGKIVDVLEGTRKLSDFPDVDGAHFIDAGKKYILPGLVEYVASPTHPGPAVR